MDAIARRYEYTKALHNFAYFHDRDVHGIEPDEIVKSSAGVHGWAEAELDTSTDPLRSGMELPPTADEHRHGERNNVKNTKDPPESKPQMSLKEAAEVVAAHENKLEYRERVLQRQQEQLSRGQIPIGIHEARQIEKITREQWLEVRRDRREARAEVEKAQARALNVFLYGEDGANSGGPICSAWQKEESGWTRVKVIMDSGAAESVCPRSMAPQFRVQDSLASRSGVFYTSANGGKIMNLGEQHIPVALSNGARTICAFQVAEVSRPLMSVSKLCEMGNRVLFGANGGVIMNLRSGEMTPFAKEEGVYTFDIWIPPLSESPFARP